jgi:hypothetical protein
MTGDAIAHAEKSGIGQFADEALQEDAVNAVFAHPLEMKTHR